MLGRRMMFLGMLAAAIGVPVGLLDDGLHAKLGEVWSQVTGSLGGVPPTAAIEGPGGSINDQFGGDTQQLLGGGGYAGLAPAGPLPPQEGPTVRWLSEVIRFDATPAWVLHNWRRVSTVTAEREMQGMRVAWVSGTGLDDLVGSLTYYFDKQHAVQRITFTGSTGQDTKLIELAQQCGMQPQPTLSAGLYLIRYNGKPMSMIMLRPATTLSAEAPQRRYDVVIEINRPNYRYALSAENQALLDFEKASQRW